MNTTQRLALNLMAEGSHGALLVAGFGWVFPTHIRDYRDAKGQDRAKAIAEAVVAKLSK